jgi:hypothetical protein
MVKVRGSPVVVSLWREDGSPGRRPGALSESHTVADERDNRIYGAEAHRKELVLRLRRGRAPIHTSCESVAAGRVHSVSRCPNQSQIDIGRTRTPNNLLTRWRLLNLTIRRIVLCNLFQRQAILALFPVPVAGRRIRLHLQPPMNTLPRHLNRGGLPRNGHSGRAVRGLTALPLSDGRSPVSVPWDGTNLSGKYRALVLGRVGVKPVHGPRRNLVWRLAKGSLTSPSTSNSSSGGSFAHKRRRRAFYPLLDFPMFTASSTALQAKLPQSCRS